MKEWSLARVFAGLHDEIERRLMTVRRTIGHPNTMGRASDAVWLDLLGTYLPRRYQAATAHVADSTGAFSQQIDVVVFDRQYSPFILHYQGATILPVESVYAVLETKQVMNAKHFAYAQEKAASVRRLHRTSLPIPHAGRTYPAKPPVPILGGILTFESDWSPPFGRPFRAAADAGGPAGRLDIGCIATQGYFRLDRATGAYETSAGGKAATAFLLALIGQLQGLATVPMIDVQAYADWLSK